MTKFCFIDLLILNNVNTSAPVKKPANRESKLIIPCQYKSVKSTEEI